MALLQGVVTPEEQMDEDLSKDVLSLRAVLGSDSDENDDAPPPSNHSNSPEATWRCSQAPALASPPCSLQGQLLNLLRANRELQSHIQGVMDKIDAALEENKLKQEELISTAQDHCHGIRTYATVFSVSYPYFIDYRKEAPPTQSSIECDLSLTSLVHWKIPVFWSSKREENLVAGIKQISIDDTMAPVRGRLDLTDIDRIREEMLYVREQPDQPLPRYLEINSWNQLAYQQFNNAVSGSDCRLWWTNHAHPSLNNDPWNKEEDQKMIQLVKDLGKQNWEQVAEELGTNRTPLACLQRYQRSYSDEVVTSEWTEEQKVRLMEGVKRFGRKWGAVSSYVGQHNATQCFNQYSHQMRHKQGRWSKDEDELLKVAVERYGDSGTVWSQIAALVPTRSSQQCRERWKNCIKGRALLRPWSSEDSDKLLTLAAEYINNDCLVSWSELASKLNRRDDSCRKRFLLVASKEQKLRMKTLRVKQNKAVRKKYVKKVDKTKLIPADIADEMLGESDREMLEEYSEKITRQEENRSLSVVDYNKTTHSRRKKRRIDNDEGSQSSVSGEANQTTPTSISAVESSSQPDMGQQPSVSTPVPHCQIPPPLIPILPNCSPHDSLPSTSSVDISQVSDQVHGQQCLVPYVVVVDVPGQSPAILKTMYLPLVNPITTTSSLPSTTQSSLTSSVFPSSTTVSIGSGQQFTFPSVRDSSLTATSNCDSPSDIAASPSTSSQPPSAVLSQEADPSTGNPLVIVEDLSDSTITGEEEGDSVLTSREQSSATEQPMPPSQLQASPSSFTVSNALAQARHILTNTSPSGHCGGTCNK